MNQTYFKVGGPKHKNKLFNKVTIAIARSLLLWLLLCLVSSVSYYVCICDAGMFLVFGVQTETPRH